MGLDTVSNPGTYRLLVAGFSLVGLSLVVLFGVVFLRLNQIRREQWTNRREKFWSEWLDRALAGEDGPESLPEEHRSDLSIFLSEWVDRFRTTDRTEGLAKLLKMLNLPQRLLDRYESVSYQDQLLYLTVFGLLGRREAWRYFRNGLRDSSPLKVLVSMRSMLETHPRRALGEIFKRIRKEAVPRNRTMQLLSELYDRRVEKALLDELRDSSADEKVQLIPYFRLTETDPAREWLTEALRDDPENEVAAKCLEVLGKIGDESHASIGTEFLDHEEWFVRVRAVHALGDLSFRDETVYLDMLRDSCWWARRAAAINLVESYEGRHRELEKIYDQIEDEYAREQLAEIMEEGRTWEA